MVRSKRIKELLIVAAILFGYCLLLNSVNFISYFKDGCLLGTKLWQDTSYHLMRLQSICDGLRGGQFPVKIYPNTLNGYGYASPLFYPDLFLYLPASWMLCGMELGLAYCCFLLLLSFGGTFFFYLFAKKICKKTFYAVVAAGLYLAGNYTYSVFFYMNAVGQASAACFSPLLLLGIYNMLREDFSKPWLILLGVLGITFSHTISLFLWGIALVVIVLVCFRKCILRPVWWKKVGIMIVLYLGISSAYFFPFAEQFFTTDFYQAVSPWAKLSQQATYILAIFIRGGDAPLTSRVVEYSIGMLVPLSFLLRFFVRKGESNRRRLFFVDLMIGAVLLSQLLASSLFPWKFFENTIFNAIQFPSRILMLTAPLSALSVALILEEFSLRPKKLPVKAIAAVLSVVLLAGTAVFDCIFLPPEGKTSLDTKDLYSYVGGGEWYPVYEDCYGTDGKGNPIVYVASTSDLSVRTKTGKKVDYEREENSLTIRFEAKAGETYRIPLLYYLGYGAENEGEEVTVEHDGYGRMEVTAKKDGTMTISYCGTPIQTVSYVLSPVALVGACAYYAVSFYRKRKNDRFKSPGHHQESV